MIPDKLAWAVTLLASKHRTLKRLSLVLHFFDYSRDPHTVQSHTPLMSEVLNSRKLLYSLRAVRPLQDINVEVFDKKSTSGKNLQPFVEAIVEPNKWTCESIQGEHKAHIIKHSDEDDTMLHQWAWQIVLHQRVWELRPAPSNTPRRD